MKLQGEIAARVIELWASGFSVRDIAERVGASKSSVHRFVISGPYERGKREAPVPQPRPQSRRARARTTRFQPEVAAKVIELHLNGATVRAISKTIGISKSAVHRFVVLGLGENRARVQRAKVSQDAAARALALRSQGSSVRAISNEVGVSESFVYRSIAVRGERRRRARRWPGAPDGVDRSWAYNIWRRYGLTVANYEALLGKQKGGCAICKNPPDGVQKLAVDHCHDSGMVRGLLCFRCNTALGQLCDDPNLIKAMLDYSLSFIHVSAA